MPRRSAASLATPQPVRLPRRLELPAGVDPAPAVIARALIASVDEQHFRAPDAHLVVQYAEALVLAADAAKHLRAEGAVVAGKPSPWLAIAEKAWRASAVLASRLRLCPSSRYDARAAARRADRPQPVDVDGFLRALEEAEQ